MMRIVARITSSLTIAVLGVSLMVNPVAATSAPVEDSQHLLVWDVLRAGDSSGTVHLQPNVPAFATSAYTLKPTFVQSLTVGDVLRIRFDVTGAIQKESSPGWSWQSGNPWDSVSITVPSIAGTGTTGYEANLMLQPDSTGVVTMTPKIYRNGVLLTGAATDYFTSIVPHVHQQIRGTSYTTTSEDISVTARTSVCADMNAVSAGTSLTPTVKIKRGGGSVTGSTQPGMNKILSPWTNFTGSGGAASVPVPNPKPSMFLAMVGDAVKVNHVSTNVVTGDVLTAEADIQKAGNVSVLAECPRLSTVGLTNRFSNISFNTPLTNNMMNAALRCEYTDLAGGDTIYSWSLINASWPMNGCSAEGLQVGHTYHVFVGYQADISSARSYYPNAEAFTTLGTPVSYEEADITITRDTLTEPTIPGTTGPGSIRWQSFDNATDTATNFLGRGNNQSLENATTNDGTDGRIASSRVGANTIRIEHWGPNGRKKFGTADYVDFTDPVSGDSRTQDYYSSLGWFGNRDKWFLLEQDNNEMVVTTGSLNDTSTSSFRITLASADAACAEAVGPDSYVMDFWRVKYTAFSAPGEYPTFNLGCAASIVGSPEWMRNAFDSFALARVTSVSNGYGTLAGIVNFAPNDGKPVNPAQSGGFNTYWLRGYTDFAVNPKQNLASSDIAVVGIHADWDTNGTIGSNYLFQPYAPDAVSITLVKVDGSVVQIAKDTSFGAYGNLVHYSVGFDGNGNIRLIWTTTSSAGVGPHTYRLIDISNTGVATLNKTFTLDNLDAFEVAPKTVWGDYVTEYPNPNNDDVSQLVLANGSGDEHKLYVARYAPGIGMAYGVLNIDTGSVWTGEAAVGSAFVYRPYPGATNGTFDFDNSGNMFYSRKYKDSTFSVLRWGTGIDPTAGPAITSGSTFTIAAGTKSVETATSTATNGTWAISGGANSSLFQINSSTGALEFKSNASVGDYVVEITVTEGGKTATQSVTVHVTDQTAPNFTANNVTVNKNSTAAFTPSAATESGTYTLGGNDASLFNIDSSTGAVTFKNPAAVGVYTVEVTLTDGAGNHTTKTVVVTVVDGPSITSAADVTVEKGTLAVQDVTTSITSPTWSIDGGADSSKFTIDASGHLKFKTAQPVGDYVVTVKATHGGDTATKTITVHVVDTTDPEFDLSPSINAETGTSGTIATPSNATEAGTYTLGGVDAGLFNINPTTGAISLADPNQALGDYSISVTLTDPSGNSVTHTTVIHVVAHIEVGSPSPASRQTVSGGKTRISWTAASNAVRYVVKYGTKVLCTTTNTTCTIKGVHPKSHQIRVYAYASNNDVESVVAEAIGPNLTKLGLVHFAVDSSYLDLKAVRLLNKLVKAIKAAGYSTIYIYGHTDNQGPAPHDISLSNRRARQVWLYLKKRLSNVTFVRAGYSRNQPAKANTSQANKAYNRRAEVWGS